EGPPPRPDAPLLQGRQGQDRARRRPREGASRQASRPRRARRQTPDGAGPQGPSIALRSPIASSRVFTAQSTSATAVSPHFSTSSRAHLAPRAVARPCSSASVGTSVLTWMRSGKSPSPRAYSPPYVV